MIRLRRTVCVLVAGGLLAGVSRPSAQHPPTIEQYLRPGLPVELVSARKADRIAWIAYEEGKRNVFSAGAPLFRPVRVTAFLKDDGIDMTSVRISDDGGVVAFVRGSAPNRDGWVANPASDPAGADRTIWAARVAVPGSARRLAEGNNPDLSPDGRAVIYLKDGQIYRAPVIAPAAPTKMDKGEEPFIKAWGANSNPHFSPDGSKISFVSNRADHSFIGLYDVKTRTLTYVAPSTDRDTNAVWSLDSKRLAFQRRPGLPFGQQATPGSGSGLPANGVAGGRGGGGGRGAAPAPAPAFGARGATPAPAAAAPPAPAPIAAAPAAAPQGRQGGRGGRGGGEPPVPPGTPLGDQPGLYRATFPGAYTLSLMLAEIPATITSTDQTVSAKEVWHTTPDERLFTGINGMQWADNHVVFTVQVQDDEFERYFSLSLAGTNPTEKPTLLTTTNGIIEDATATALSKDGKTLYYCTNASDIDRRHIWSVPVAGGKPAQVTTGEGIENVPAPLASGKQIAVLSSDAKRPFSVGVWPSAAGAAPTTQKVVYPTLGADFPMNEEVVPTNVTLKAADGVEFHNQLFLPRDMKPGQRYPAMIFVHGGPQRQMLLGWHYLSFYHVFYGVNEWLASKGVVVMSVNYRSGVGYGRSFRQAAEVGARGNSEYRDVLAAGKWLASRDYVDPDRFGIWGLSYGGLLTAEALSRDSDLFRVGVDLAGVHLEGSSLDPKDVSYQASSIANIDKWTSPVLLIQGDDDRNVNFAQMVGLVNLLRVRKVHYELIVYPDDVHETLLHRRWLNSFAHMEDFLQRYLLSTPLVSDKR